MILLSLCFAPGVLGLLGVHADHCVLHQDHPHLCLVHATQPLTLALAATLLLGVGWFVDGISRAALRVARQRRLIASLQVGGSLGMDDGAWLVESTEVFSFTSGFWRPEVFVSTALVESLPRHHFDAVMEHEAAHRRRRDGLQQLVANALSCLHLPGVRRKLLAELFLTTEQACDEEAARRLGGRTRVAEAILAVERLQPHGAPAALPAFGGSSVPDRVRALLAEPPPAPTGLPMRWAALGLPAAVWILDPLHHATEHLLGLFFGA